MKSTKAKYLPVTLRPLNVKEQQHLANAREAAARTLVWLETIFGKNWKAFETFTTETVRWSLDGIDVVFRLDTGDALTGQTCLELELVNKIYTNQGYDVDDDHVYMFVEASSFLSFEKRLRKAIADMYHATKALAEKAQRSESMLVQYHASASP